MLRYLILSTPRCGSSILMASAAIVFGKDSFIREPLNPYEDQKWHPDFLHRKSVSDRAVMLCAPDCPVLGIKHVFSPFNQAMSSASDIEALARILMLPGLKVILLSRENIFHQLISMEIALQTGDWWSSGPAALPPVLGPVRAGGEVPLDEGALLMRLEKLRQSTQKMRDICDLLKVDWREWTYESLFAPSPDEAAMKVQDCLSHFDGQASRAVPQSAFRQLIDQGRRFDEMTSYYEQVANQYPELTSRFS